MSDIKARKFKCTGCGEDRPCYLETNRESSIMDVYTEDTLKCVLDETNHTSYNWVEVQANGITTGAEQCNLPVVMPRISHFIDENGTTVDLNAEGVNVRLKKDGTHEYFRSFGFAGRKELTPVYGA